MTIEAAEKRYRKGYRNGYKDAYNGLQYEDYGSRYEAWYDYGYSVGYEAGYYKDRPEFQIKRDALTRRKASASNLRNRQIENLPEPVQLSL